MPEYRTRRVVRRCRGHCCVPVPWWDDGVATARLLSSSRSTTTTSPGALEVKGPQKLGMIGQNPVGLL